MRKAILPIQNYELSEQRRKEATELTADQADTWNAIVATAQPGTRLNFRVPRSEWTRPNPDRGVRLLMGLKLNRVFLLEPHADIAGQAADELLGLAAELTELAHQVSAIQPIATAN